MASRQIEYEEKLASQFDKERRDHLYIQALLNYLRQKSWRYPNAEYYGWSSSGHLYDLWDRPNDIAKMLNGKILSHSSIGKVKLITTHKKGFLVVNFYPKESK